MESFDWRTFLGEFSQELLADEELRARLPEDVRASGWLGFQGATQAEIDALESRLGTRLPGSYRAFLSVTNGWRATGPFIERLWSTEEVAWFRERNQEWIDIWNRPVRTPRGELRELLPVADSEYFVYGEAQRTTSMRPEYLQTSLEISDCGDSAILLLNPRIIFKDGEWEAWFFANWYPGAVRQRSFRELMQHELTKLRLVNERSLLPEAERREREAGEILKKARKNLEEGDRRRCGNLLRILAQQYGKTQAARETQELWEQLRARSNEA